MIKHKKIYLADIDWHSKIAGPWMTTTLFVQGCRRACPGCFNPQTWDMSKQFEMRADMIANRLIDCVPYKRLSISGGEPMLQARGLMDMLQVLRRFENGSLSKWKILCYTGYTWEELTEDLALGSAPLYFLQLVDILVDGAFDKEKALPIGEYQFVGSTNQRVIDVKKSLKKKEIVLWKPSLKDWYYRVRDHNAVKENGVLSFKGRSYLV